MAKRPHIKLNTAVQQERAARMYFNYGFGDDGKEQPLDPNYMPMAETFRTSLIRLENDVQTRRVERNDALALPAHIEYIQIQFQDQFDIAKYYQSWYNEFGLAGVNFSHFNRVGLFAVTDRDRFKTFLEDINNFVLKESGENENVRYRGKIRFIRDFKLLTTQGILNYQEECQLMNFKLIDFPAGSHEAGMIFRHLQEYLTDRGYEFRLSDKTSLLEVFDAPEGMIEEIARNFDIIQSVTSSLSSVVRPSKFNIVERGYGFEIINSEENLPIIGILDTGISTSTPLDSIILHDERFNLTKSSPFVDNAYDGLGHGTSVGALAALGRRPYAVNYAGGIQADAKLLSMKILDTNSGYLSAIDIIGMLKHAKSEYPGIRLFVLTTCYSVHKATNEDFSPYAFELDKFAFENDCLIFICTANNHLAANQPGYSLNYFNQEETNLSSPADSMNNVVVGAAADNLGTGAFVGISHGREFPTLFSRKCHIDLEFYRDTDRITTKINPHLFRPDVIESGGDYEQGEGFIGTNHAALMELLSANPAYGFYRDVGTSFSAPLVANIAAQVLNSYPTLRTQTLKALIVNSASLDRIVFDKPFLKLRNKTAGHGIIDADKCVGSDDNAITFIVEDEIRPGEMKIIPLNFPAYLTQDDLGKRQGILQLTATLCFSFEPVQNNHLSYCPLQLAFAFFRNNTGENILKSENEQKGGVKTKWKMGWSQDNRWKSSPVPASNTQKIRVPISVNDLQNEGSTLKLAVHCLTTTQLLNPDQYQKPHQFSMAITIEENLPTARQTGRLYEELIAVNECENIIHVEGEAEAEGTTK